MSDTSRYPHWSGGTTTFTYAPEGQLVSVEVAVPPGSTWQHNEASRLFRVTDPGGKATEFDDRALQLLIVEPDVSGGVQDASGVPVTVIANGTQIAGSRRRSVRD